MPHFILIAKDKPNDLEKRLETRAEHLAYIETFGKAIALAGPILGGPDNTPSGSMIILDMPDMKAAEAFAENDPYTKAGLFAETQINPYKIVVHTL